MARKRLRDIVVVLPGITGSVLQKDGKDLWAISGRAAWRALKSLGKNLQDLELGEDDPLAAEAGDGVRAVRIMPDAHLVPGLIKIDGYGRTVRTIRDHFEVVEGTLGRGFPANFFEFHYDWRRDNRAHARQLKLLMDRQLPMWREHVNAPDARIILIAHSMGGLVSRYYLEALDGWRDCKALITFGTPYRGAVNALGFLANGYKKLFLDLTEVMRSFPSVYQLMPIYKALKVGDDWQRVAETDGVPNVDRQRAADALAFHREIESAVERHREDGEYRDRGYKIVPIVGIRQPTLQSATLADGEVSVARELPEWIDPMFGDGDGTVPRASAIPIELSSEYRDTFVPEQHGSLQANRHILGDLLGRLEQMQASGMDNIRGGPVVTRAPEREAALAVDIDDLYLAGEPVELRASLVNADGRFGAVRAEVEPLADTPGAAAEHTFEAGDEAHSLVLDGLAPGLYRATVSTEKRGGAAPPPVHAVFEIGGQ